MKQLLNIGKYIVAVGTIAGAALFFDARTDKSLENDKIMMEAMEHISIEQQFMAEDILNLQDTLDEFEEEQKRQSDNIESLGWAIGNIDNFTPEQMEEILNRELKKNSVNLTPLKIDFPTWMIQEPSTELILDQRREMY